MTRPCPLYNHLFFLILFNVKITLHLNMKFICITDQSSNIVLHNFHLLQNNYPINTIFHVCFYFRPYATLLLVPVRSSSFSVSFIFVRMTSRCNNKMHKVHYVPVTPPNRLQTGPVTNQFLAIDSLYYFVFVLFRSNNYRSGVNLH